MPNTRRNRLIAGLRRASNRLAAVITIGFLLILPSTSLEAAPTEREFLVVHGARDVQEHRVSDSRSVVVYTIQLTYPSPAIGERERNLLEAAGWKRCQGGHPDWIAFESDSTPGLIHQQVTYWARGDSTIAIELRYYSFGLERTDNVIPNNSHQLVTVVFDDDPSRRNPVAWRALRCP